MKWLLDEFPLEREEYLLRANAVVTRRIARRSA